MEQSEFTKTILDILSPIGGISANKNKEYVGLYKDGTMFGKISEKKVLLLKHTNRFAEVENTLITRLLKSEKNPVDVDIFLQEVTKAWWLAHDKTS
jgi:TfoX/Sxy family transcriptional regulator of competence genes